MPLYFKTTIGQSSISGTGIIALEDIPEGATYWTFEEEGNSIIPENCPNYNENLLLTEDDFKKLTDEKIRKVLHCGFFYAVSDQHIYLRDGTGVMNHSEEHNSFTIFDKDGDPKKMKSIAKRLIKRGEEITENYNAWHPRDSQSTWIIEMFEKYLPQDISFHDDVKSENTVYSKKH